ncbi:DUF5696 domain-containing protein [Thermobacillus composti]|nr:DUF5696 domain-containing protein [Thermobacillus composti]
MRMVRKPLLIACLAAMIGLAGCSGSHPGAADETAGTTDAFTPGAPLAASFTDAQLSGMKGIAENEYLQLFVDDQTGAIAVRDKRSGDIWHSNPPDRDQDPIASGVNKDLLSAQLKLDYYNRFGQLQSINTYTDSVAHKQIAFEPIPDGVRVTWQFGTAERTAADLPLMLSEARFKELSGKLDRTGQRALTIAYKKDPDKPVYVRNDSALSGLQLARTFKAFEDAGYTEEDLQQDTEELGFTQEKPEARIFLAAIEYTLDGDNLLVNVPVADIRYPEGFPVGEVSVLSFFGAGGQDDRGSIFVPDGSGALIHFNNGKTMVPAYRQTVYGTDLTMERTEDAIREQAVRLPVFGIIREGESAFLAIIEQGASVASINADVAGRLNSYNYVYPSFQMINKDEVTLQADDQHRTLPKFQERPVRTDFTIRYAFLSGREASYAGMAQYYQQYLERTGGLPRRQTDRETDGETDMPFYLQLIGSIDKKKHVVGIPYRALEPLTTFEQAKTIIRRLQERGVHRINLKYAGWFNGGLDHSVPERIAVDRAVGGSRGLREFTAFVREQGISFFPDVAVVMAHSGKSFRESKDAARTLRGVPAAIYPLDPALGRRDVGRSPSYVVSPRLVGSYVEGMLDGIAAYETGGISLRDLADRLNSDYRKRRTIDRAESESISVRALQRIHEADLDIMAEGGNAYALPYVTDITNAPLASSGFKIEDETIPFYQMVIRGYIDYTGAPFNLSHYPNERQYVLRCLEYGSGVSFTWIHEPNYKVKDTDHHDLYAVHYALWMDKAADIYREVNEVLKDVRHERIVAHEKLDEGVFKTVYESGMSVIVNYNGHPVTAEGRTIEAESYVTGGERS